MKGDNAGLEAVIARLRADKAELESELYHRLDRNLTLVRGLVESSADMPQGLKMRLRDRMAALGLVQDLLDSRKLGEERRFTELCKGLSAWFGVSRPSSLNIRMGAVSDGPALHPSELKDLGLILGELLQNSWDHAFPDGRVGDIRIRLSSWPGGGYSLAYRDDGIGLPEGVDAAKGGGGGLFLVRAIVSELGGGIEIGEGGGTAWRIDIPAPRPRGRS